MSKYQGPRGTSDLYGKEIQQWQLIEERIREFTRLYQIEEIRTPEFEHTEVFVRENDSSDVVNKEMYTFEDNGGRSLTLKPEGTAGLIRAVIEHKLYTNPEPLHKYFYITPAFRYERPQKGRFRIHHQFGVEFMGEKSPLVDVEAIQLGLRLTQSFGLNNLKLHINTLGDDESRQNYRSILQSYFKPHLDDLCGDCQRRYVQNPMRIIDCKVDGDKEVVKQAPSMRDSLNEESSNYFNEVLELLDYCDIDYIVDDNIVRGLDYYTHTVFEMISENEAMGSQSTVFGGGRYDHLVENLGGPSISSVGFGMGIERLLVTLEAEGIELSLDKLCDVYGISLGHEANKTMLKLIDQVRQESISAEMDVANRSMKAQFKSADRHQAQLILILGDEELKQGTIRLKNTKTQQQFDISQVELINKIKEQLEVEE
ncbi:MAG: histidine--tRNA ligase [Erysipelothrix sp.]|nr:histidine--tRNA ligase [Erysipelothrix sp.]